MSTSEIYSHLNVDALKEAIKVFDNNKLSQSSLSDAQSIIKNGNEKVQNRNNI